MKNSKAERCASWDDIALQFDAVFKYTWDAEKKLNYHALYLSNHTHGGNSGSPVLDNSGKVVGVIFAGNSQTLHGLAVPLEELKVMLDKYK